MALEVLNPSGFIPSGTQRAEQPPAGEPAGRPSWATSLPVPADAQAHLPQEAG